MDGGILREHIYFSENDRLAYCYVLIDWKLIQVVYIDRM